MSARRDEAARDHAGHFRRIRDKRPHVILKLAVSSDDKIGAAGRKPVAITGEAARARASAARAMRCHPGRHRHGAGRRSAADLSAARHGRALAGARGARSRAAPSRHEQAGAFGARDAAVGDDLESVGSARRDEARRRRRAGDPRADHDAPPPGLDLTAVLHELAAKGITRLLVEGGARVASSFVAAGLVDEVWLLRGPAAIGADGVAALDALPLTAITAVAAFRVRASESAGAGHTDDLRASLMFTGIVTDIGEIDSLTPTAQGQLHRLRILCRYDQTTIADGASIACNGVCLTVVGFRRGTGGKTWFEVDAAAETLGMTTAQTLERRHAAQSRARAEDRRRTRRPYRRRPCRRHRDASSARDDLPDMARFELRTHARTGALHRAPRAR